MIERRNNWKDEKKISLMTLIGQEEVQPLLMVSKITSDKMDIQIC